MSNELKNRFDASIKAALENHQVPYDESTWDILEDRMHHAELAADAALEEATKKALSNYKAPYDHSTWHTLSERLDQIEYRNRLIGAKVFEAAVILLAVLTLVKFLGQIPDLQNDLPLPFAKSHESSPATQSDTEMGIVDGLENDPSALSQKEKNANQTLASGSVKSLKQNDKRAKDGRVNALPLASTLNKARQVFYQEQVLKTIKENVNYFQQDAAPGKRSSASDVARLSQREMVLPGVVRNIASRSDRADGVPLLPLYDMSMLVAETAHDFHIAAVERVPKVRTKFKVFYQNNVHRIENVARRQNDYNQTETSNGLGFAANMQFGRVGFDLGAVVDQVTYDAGFFGQNEIRRIQIPLNLRYSGLHTKYADFYVKGGVSAHGVTKGHYEAPVLASAAPGPRKPVPHYNDGLLNDGNYEDNTYFTVNGGVGLDISLSKSFSLFAECLYQKRLKGEIGLTKDKFNTFSTNLGVSYTFK